MENNNEVFLRVTNHTGQAEKNLLGPAGIRTRDLRFTSPTFGLLVLHPSSLSHHNHLKLEVILIISDDLARQGRASGWKRDNDVWSEGSSRLYRLMFHIRISNSKDSPNPNREPNS